MYNVAHKVWTGSDMTLSCALVPSRYTSDLKIKSRSPKLEQKCKAQWKLYKVWKNSPRAEEGRKKLNVKVFCYWRPYETHPYIDCHDPPPPAPPFFFPRLFFKASQSRSCPFFLLPPLLSQHATSEAMPWQQSSVRIPTELFKCW